MQTIILALENMREGWLRVRSTEEYRRKISKQKQGTKNPSSVLNDDKVRAIKNQYRELVNKMAKTEAQYYLANEFNVSRSTILDIIHNRTWKHVK